jgi:hypothetical protein
LVIVGTGERTTASLLLQQRQISVFFVMMGRHVILFSILEDGQQ